MKIHRYELIDSSSLARLNELMRHGWVPIRELATVPGNSTPNTSHLVLLEKEAEVHEYPGESLIEGVPVEFLSGVMLFEDFTIAEIRQVVSLCRITTKPAGAEVFARNAPADALFVVLKGNVEILLPELPVEDTQVVQLNPGGVFGESTFFSETSHTMSATCASDSVTLLSLGRESYDELFQSQPAVALRLVHNVARILAARLQETDQWVWTLLQESQFARISSSWRRFRHRVGGTDSAGGGFFGI